ncbi:MAG TPA: pantoate--beta-alanine ligase [Polyangiaceae bacterium]|nr:pantoate--beta-alanine ligase [Polyangiaceae bacterium]
MEILEDVASFRAACEQVRRQAGRVGFVPTMGALHAGHLALVERAKALGTHVAVSIFVNPTQFGPSEDFTRYPRDLPADLERCRAAGVDAVFCPEISEIYPPGERTRVHVSGLGDRLCGASRPGHFEGVATVVTKLLAVAGPCTAVFGRKDYQQLKIIERLCRDLLLDVDVVGHPIVRDADGLALSSRNAYLSPAERQSACAIPQALSQVVARYGAGERSGAALRELVTASFERAGLRIDYVELAFPDTLEIVPLDVPLPEPQVLLAVAAFAGATRLIDNVVLGLDPPPLPVRRA